MALTICSITYLVLLAINKVRNDNKKSIKIKKIINYGITK